MANVGTQAQNPKSPSKTLLVNSKFHALHEGRDWWEGVEENNKIRERQQQFSRSFSAISHPLKHPLNQNFRADEVVDVVRNYLKWAVRSIVWFRIRLMKIRKAVKKLLKWESDIREFREGLIKNIVNSWKQDEDKQRKHLHKKILKDILVRGDDARQAMDIYLKVIVPDPVKHKVVLDSYWNARASHHKKILAIMKTRRDLCNTKRQLQEKLSNTYSLYRNLDAIHNLEEMKRIRTLIKNLPPDPPFVFEPTIEALVKASESYRSLSLITHSQPASRRSSFILDNLSQTDSDSRDETESPTTPTKLLRSGSGNIKLDPLNPPKRSISPTEATLAIPRRRSRSSSVIVDSLSEYDKLSKSSPSIYSTNKVSPMKREGSCNDLLAPITSLLEKTERTLSNSPESMRRGSIRKDFLKTARSVREILPEIQKVASSPKLESVVINPTISPNLQPRRRLSTLRKNFDVPTIDKIQPPLSLNSTST